jgi:hypothetical protein
MSVKKNQKTRTGRSLAQFEVIALVNTEKLAIKGGTGEQVEHGGTNIIIVLQ